MNTGLTKIVHQVVGGAGKVIGNAVRHAQQNADAPSRHPRVREAGLGQSWNPGLSSVDMNSRVRGSDKLVADRIAITLSDDAIAANRRTADALGKVCGVCDLPRFTADAINTDPRRFRTLEQMFRSLRFFTRVIFDGLGWQGGVAPRY